MSPFDFVSKKTMMDLVVSMMLNFGMHTECGVMRANLNGFNVPFVKQSFLNLGVDTDMSRLAAFRTPTAKRTNRQPSFGRSEERWCEWQASKTNPLDQIMG